MKKIILAILTFVLTACNSDDKDYDAMGTFEATEVIVSAEQNGRLINFDVEEGNNLNEGQPVGTIDTVQLYLRARQLGATRQSYASQRPDISKQTAATIQQLKKAEMERDRYAKLVKDNAANKKLLDDAENNVRVLRRQLEALRSSLDNSTGSLDKQMDAVEIERRQVLDQLEKCHIKSPINGTVLEKYAEAGEYATLGKPLFKIADINDMKLRVYISAEQMTELKIGSRVKVYADMGKDDRREYPGVVEWISDKAEFTPKTIQTRDERANLVYAVKIAVKNTDGLIKIGMYGDVRF